MQADHQDQHECRRDELLAAMLFPNDEDLRFSYFNRQKLVRRYGVAEGDQEVTFTVAELRGLTRLHSSKEMRSATARQARKGYTVGQLLGVIVEMELSERVGDRPSLRIAYKVMDRFGKGHLGQGASRFRDGRARPALKTIEKYWREMKSVAHFWAALSLNLEYKIIDVDRDLSMLDTPDSFELFLAIAENLRSVAESVVPENSPDKRSIMHGANSVLRPALEYKFTYAPNREPDRLLRILDEIREEEKS